jgi:hypothetical protein
MLARITDSEPPRLVCDGRRGRLPFDEAHTESVATFRRTSSWTTQLSKLVSA